MEIEEAQALVKQSLSPILEFEETALKDSYGKILFEDVLMSMARARKIPLNLMCWKNFMPAIGKKFLMQKNLPSAL